MSAFEAVEMDVTVRAKIVTYYPSTVVENQIKFMRKINEAFSEAGKEMDFLPSPVTLSIEGELE